VSRPARRRASALLCIAFVSSAPAPARVCRDAPFPEYVQKLQALTPAVAVERPAPADVARFFAALPRDFECFNHLFGYYDDAGPFYAKPYLHLLFRHIARAVPERDYVAKIVGLSVNAHGQADQTGALKRASREILDRRAHVFVAALEPLDAASERSVWAFLFGAPHPSNTPLTLEVQARVCKASERSCESSKQAYARARLNERRH